MRKPVCLKFFHHPWPLAKSWRVDTVFDAAVEQDLQAHTNPQYRPASSQPPLDHFVASCGPKKRHHRGKGPHTGDNESISIHHGLPLRGQLDLGTGALEGFDRGVHIARAVVEDDDLWPGGHDYRAPLVEGIPSTRSSSAMAFRSARAKALNWASAMWWGSRPSITVM